MTFDTQTARVQLSHAIECAIELLDALGGDPDLEMEWDGDPDADLEPDVDDEPGGDEEPSLGSIGSGHAEMSQARWADGAPDDLEDEHDGGEPDMCREPSLGSLDRQANQERWAGFGGFDACADLELDRSDSEPSLGSPAGGDGNQERWAQGVDAEPNGDEMDATGAEDEWMSDLSDEVRATRRTAAWLADAVARLQDAERLGMLS